MLCTACQGISLIDYNRLEGGEIPVDFQRCDTLPDCPLLKSTAETGCLLCDLLLDEISSTLPSVTETTPFTINSAKYTCESYLHARDELPLQKNGIYCLEITFHCERPKPGTETELRFGVYADLMPDKGIFDEIPSGPPVDFGLLRRRMPNDRPDSSSCIALMKQWIHTCMNGHAKCKHHKEETFFPTRVIDVGQSDSDPKVRLVTGITHGSYLTLSHCWGDPSMISMLKTETDNLKDRHTGFPTSSMPQNFHDAVIITRLLRVRYLWIDALCIIQDSEVDWDHESAQMNQVYKHSLATLVATSAGSCDEGFLQQRYYASKKKARIPYTVKNNMETSGEYILQADPRVRFGDYTLDVECPKWNNRGWTLQERFFSPRLIHLTSNKIYLECGTAIYAEDNEEISVAPLGYSYVRHDQDQSSVSAPVASSDGFASYSAAGSEETHPNASSEAESLSSSDAYERWYQQVSTYTPRDLTYESDKLPAISGLASEIAELTGDRYLAGLWEGGITRGLLWMSIAQDDEISPQSRYRAPSWSWASLNGHITGPNHSAVNMRTDRSPVYGEPVLHLLEAHIKLKGRDPFGAITSASLKVSGRMTKAELSGPLVRHISWRLESRFPFEIKVSRSGKVQHVGFGHLDMRNLDLVPKEDIWCLQVERQSPGSARFEDLWCGLLLTVANEENEGRTGIENEVTCFKRVGVFILSEDHLDLFEGCEETVFDLV